MNFSCRDTNNASARDTGYLPATTKGEPGPGDMSVISGLPGSGLELEEGAGIRVKGEHFWVAFDRTTGSMSRFFIGGYDAFYGPMLPYWWKGDDAYCVDRIYPFHWCTTTTGLVRIVPVNISACQIGKGSMVVTVKNDLETSKGIIKQQADYNIHSSGLIIVQNRFILQDNIEPLPPLGMCLALSKDFIKMEWYENAAGHAAVNPVVNESKAGLRWLKLSSDRQSFFICGIPHIHASIQSLITDMRNPSEPEYSFQTRCATRLHIYYAHQDANDGDPLFCTKQIADMTEGSEYHFSFKMRVTGIH